ncbi:MAG: 6-bladed beta-propeller [Niabella sp.]
MRKTFFLNFALLLLHSIIWAQPQKLYFDPAYAQGMPQSKIFDSIQYIPLETTKESLLGRVSQLVVTGEYIIVLDNDTKAIYFFDWHGKFIKKYSDRKYDIKSIFYSKEKNALFISELNKNYSPSKREIQDALDNPLNNQAVKNTRAVYYYLDDVLAEKIIPLKDFDIAVLNPVAFNHKLWVYSHIYANKNWENKEDFELKISDGKEIIATYFPYNKKTSSLYYGRPERIPFFKTANKTSLLFTRPYRYTVYELTPDSVAERYTIILPSSNTIPNTFYSQSFDTRSKLEDFKMNNPGLVWGIENVVDTKAYLFFGLDIYRSFRDRNYLFEKKTAQFFNLSKIAADSTNAFLPVASYGIQYYDEDYLYSSTSSASMFNNKDANASRNPQYNEVITKYFTNSKSSANPVVIVLKPKSNSK